MNKTNTLIGKLALDVKNPSLSKGWKITFWKNWGIGFFLTASLTLVAALLLPNDLRFPENPLNVEFIMQALFWFTLSVAGAFLTYLSSLPMEKTKGLSLFCKVVVSVLVLFVLFQTSIENLSTDFVQELNVQQGPCGIFILIMSSIWTFSLFATIKKAAPINLALTGASLALSTGAATSMLIHFFCRHETSSHMVLWHFLPLTLVIFASWKNSSKFLRW
ncbi:MAG: NrsF family protein [Bacteriovoracaceae bacterium]